MSRNHTEDELENMSEEERDKIQRRDNRRLRRKTRDIRVAILDRVSKGTVSEEFPELDGSNKQIYALVPILDGVDRDVQESEKQMDTRSSNAVGGAMISALFEQVIHRIGDPSNAFATGERGMRTVGDDRRRLRPENTATDEHMRKGNDVIDFDDVFYKDGKPEDKK